MCVNRVGLVIDGWFNRVLDWVAVVHTGGLSCTYSRLVLIHVYFLTQRLYVSHVVRQ